MALSADKQTQYKEGVEIPLPVGAEKKIYAGSLVVLDGTTRLAEAGSDASGKVFAGVSREYVDNSLGAASAKTVLVRRRGLFLFDIAAATQADVGKAVFVVDDQTVGLAATTDNDIYCGVIAAVESATQVWVDIHPALLQSDVATHIADTSAAHAAGSISIADTGSLITGTDVEAALAEIMTAMKTAQYSIFPDRITLEDGTAIGKFSSADEATCGWAQIGNKEVGLRWNNHATPAKVAVHFTLPQDMNEAAGAVVHLLGAVVKAGGSAVDSPVFSIEAFFETAGAAPAADTDCGGDSAEFTASDNYAEKTLFIAHGDVPAPPCGLTLVINPKDGQLGTDDFLLSNIWLEVTRLALTA